VGRKGPVAEKKQLGSLDQPISRLAHVVHRTGLDRQGTTVEIRSREHASPEASHGWITSQAKQVISAPQVLLPCEEAEGPKVGGRWREKGKKKNEVKDGRPRSG
jgi:hypothetical protein